MSYYSSRSLAVKHNKPHSYITKDIRKLEKQGVITSVVQSSYVCEQNKQVYSELCIDSSSLITLLNYWKEKEPKRVRKSKLSKSKKLAVKTKDSFACVNCGSKSDLCVDHKVPEAMGGDSTLSNLQTLCRSCNSRKGTKAMQEWEASK